MQDTTPDPGSRRGHGPGGNRAAYILSNPACATTADQFFTALASLPGMSRAHMPRTLGSTITNNVR